MPNLARGQPIRHFQADFLQEASFYFNHRTLVVRSVTRHRTPNHPDRQFGSVQPQNLGANARSQRPCRAGRFPPALTHKIDRTCEHASLLYDLQVRDQSTQSIYPSQPADQGRSAAVFKPWGAQPKPKPVDYRNQSLSHCQFGNGGPYDIPRGSEPRYQAIFKMRRRL